MSNELFVSVLCPIPVLTSSRTRNVQSRLNCWVRYPGTPQVNHGNVKCFRYIINCISINLSPTCTKVLPSSIVMFLFHSLVVLSCNATTQVAIPCRSTEGMSILFQNQLQSWSRSKLTSAKISSFIMPIPCVSPL